MKKQRKLGKKGVAKTPKKVIAKTKTSAGLTKKVKTEILGIHDRYWSSYLKGDVKTMTTLLAEGYSQVGSAETEVFFNKKDAVKFLRDTIKQVAGKVDMKKRVTKLEVHGDMILIHELCDLYGKADKKWVFYSKFRASTWLKEFNDSWKIIHQHSSFPDARADEGENLAIEKIEAENQQLREAVKRRTIELEHKNRELAIEAAMEKVRARSLAMQKPEELAEVSKVLRNEMGALGVEELETSSIYIIDDTKGITECWYAIKDVRGKNKKLVTDHMTLPLDETWVGREMQKFYRSKETRTSILMRGKNRKEWINYCAEKSSVLQGYYGGEIPERTYHLVKFSNGFMGAASPGEISQESWDLLQRATAVFSFAYKRFSDLQKSEAQAREAKIQLALERVRARTMAMQKSDELPEAATLLFQQVQSLGMPAWSAGYCTWNEDKSAVTLWMSSEGVLQPPFSAPTTEDELFIEMRKGQEDDKAFHVVEMGGKKLVKHYQYMRTLPVVGEILDSIIEAGHPLPNFQIMHHAYFSKGFLLFITYEPVPDAHDIFKRFAAVFDQTYTRFLDLQKAEAQAREAQIEAALERVRSRSMAMHKSQELIQVVGGLDKEIQGLGIEINGSQIVTDFDNVEEGANSWVKVEGQDYLEKLHVPPLEHRIYNRVYDEYQKGVYFFTASYSKEEKNEFFKLLYNSTEFRSTPKERQDFVFSTPVWIRAVVISKNSILIFQRFFPKEFSDEEGDIFKRFGKVFEQAYVRFLDLKKAEAQAREAQIEAALERVRAKTMAMHKSEQLPETAQVLFEQFAVLGEIPDRISIGVYNEELGVSEWWVTDQQGIQITHKFKAPLYEPTHAKMYTAWKEGKESVIIDLVGDELKEWVTFVRDVVKMPIDESRMKGRRVHHSAFFSQGQLLISAHEHMPLETVKLLVRFAKVFNQTYTRFLDLQKAEAQAREAKIEAALEKVRSRTMAMQHSDKLRTVVLTMYEELNKLNFNAQACNIILADKTTGDREFWVSGFTQDMYPESYKVPYIDHPYVNDQLNAWKQGEQYNAIEYSGQLKKDFDKIFFTETDFINVPADAKRMMIEAPSVTFSTAFFSHGSIQALGSSQLSTENADILKRFAKVFEQTYTRFLDLQKAEAQAREAQIEAALERVRTVAMGMTMPEDMLKICRVISEQLQQFGVAHIRNVQTVIINQEKGTYHNYQYFTPYKKEILEVVDYHKNPVAWELSNRMIESADGFFTGTLTGDVFREWRTYRKLEDQLPDPLLDEADSVNYHFYSIGPGGLGITLYRTLNEEGLEMFKRFHQVFSLAYQRFRDIEKAEALAREAQIEAALERVRSRSMAMHKSEEFPQVIQVVFEQFLLLDFKIDSAQFDVSFRETDDLNLWTAAPGQPYPTKLHIPYADYEVFNSIKKAKKAGHAFVSIQLTKEEKNDFFNYFFLHAPNIPEERKKFLLSSPGVVRSAVLLEKVSLAIQNYSGIPYSDAEHNILKRFAKAFEQTYVRFLDLQKAEAQAREATIEAALEKVRGKAMAMHNSDDLIATAGVLFAEMRKLGINTFRCGVGLLTKESRKAKLYSATTTNETDNLPMVGSALLDGHEVLTEMYDRWVRNEDYFPLMKGELLKAYYEKINSTFTVPTEQTEQYEQHGYFLPFSEGLFYGWAEKPYTEDEIKTLHRFKAIVDLTFRRYIELQKSEEIAREAVRSASLDRVRAEIASMRTKQDLERITPLIWKELTTLGIPFVRCGVFIMDEQEELIHTFLSTPDGKAIAAFHVPYGSTPLAGSIEFWREKKMYLTHWGLKEYAEFADAFIDTNEVEKRAHYLSSVPKDGIHLHLLPFMQGMLYVGNTNPLTEDNLHLVQSVADAFSTAYARYEDFNKIESAKAQAERTLVDLKQAQQQLVQSEKMASLGELTAGIAHEIQNPLNFVNNFSEVSTELVKEMAEEVEKGNLEEVKALANDVVQNLEKINHHGKRAADIVKGMLQHSRTSSGQKEPSDINALADEYLRLAYHGLRAKDKSFNATMKTNFDESIGNINIIPQDMGRVILNLITNAFYVVNERAKLNQLGFEPTVSVSTKKEGNKVLICVKDNGNGIPQKILDKIFQPFFTTKPTGQGTGLGLSLSYDIVKAHGGELKVESTNGVGSTFIINLPL